jgi:hypothetical protein
MRRTVETSGFAAPSDRPLGDGRRNAAFAALIATVALALGTVVAVTVMTVGIAHADGFGTVIDDEAGVFVAALLLGAVFIGFSGLSMLPPRGKAKK